MKKEKAALGSVFRVCLPPPLRVQLNWQGGDSLASSQLQTPTVLLPTFLTFNLSYLVLYNSYLLPLCLPTLSLSNSKSELQIFVRPGQWVSSVHKHGAELCFACPWKYFNPCGAEPGACLWYSCGTYIEKGLRAVYPGVQLTPIFCNIFPTFLNFSSPSKKRDD